MHAAAEQVPSGPHGSWIDVRLWQHAAAQQDSDFLGIDRVVFGFAAMDRFHVERVAEHKRNPFARPKVGQYQVKRDSTQTTRSAR
jgi:hypothetical protein